MILLRLFLYGVVGWTAEVVWTAAYEAVTGTRPLVEDPTVRAPLHPLERWRLAGRTYLWMLPVYGGGGLAFELAHDLVRRYPLVARGLVWTAAIFAIEYIAGLALRRLTGRCPWDYSYARLSVHGLIRLDYAPIWFLLGIGFERLHDAFVAIQGPLVTALVGQALG